MKDSSESVNVLEPPASRVESQESRAESRSWSGSRLSTLGSWLVLAALGGLAFWGHHTGWIVPSFAALTGSATKEKDDWCREHGVPESRCVECDSDLLPRGKDHGWCPKHGIPNCPFEHPEVAQLKQVPKITPADLERARRRLDFLPRPKNNEKCKLHHRRIQFASAAAVEKAGLGDPMPVWESPIVEAVSANGEITYDQTRVARLSARVPGTVWAVPKEVGEPVRRGEVLALVDAAEVGKAKAEFLQAIAQVRLRGKTYESLRSVATVVAELRVREAETALERGPDPAPGCAAGPGQPRSAGGRRGVEGPHGETDRGPRSVPRSAGFGLSIARPQNHDSQPSSCQGSPGRRGGSSRGGCG